MKRMTKTARRRNASARSKQKRMTVALRKFLQSVKPSSKATAAAVRKNPGGSITITPIKANAGGLKRVLAEYGHQRRGGTGRVAAVRRAVSSTRRNPKRRKR